MGVSYQLIRDGTNDSREASVFKVRYDKIETGGSRGGIKGQVN